jgi:DNA-binding transcriptional LysR family regulator
MKGDHSSLSGVVRVTTTDSLSVFVMADILAGIRTREKGLRIEILTANAHLDFARLKADVTVRPAQDLPNDLSGEIAAHLRFAVYTPENPSGWAVPVGPLLRSVAASWVKQHIAPEDYIASSDSFVTLSALAPQINAKVILPCIVGDGTAGLHRDPTYDLDLSTPIWVASHADLAGSTRLREVRAALMRGLASWADGLDGGD